MEKALTALLAVILCLVRGGIPMDKEIRMEPEGTETGTEWTETQKKPELTETEIALLVSTGPNEQRIRDGELTDTELRELEVIRYTVRRMEELYPGEIIEYREMNPGARGGTGISFTAWERKAGPDRTFLVFTAVGGTPEKPEYFCADNLAGQLLRPQLENTVGDILAEAGLNLHGFEADFPAQHRREKLPRRQFRQQIMAAGILHDRCFPASHYRGRFLHSLPGTSPIASRRNGSNKSA